MRQRIGDRDLEYTWFTGPGHVVSRRGNGHPGSPLVDAAGLHRLSWDISVPGVPNGKQADWNSTYAPDVPLDTILLPILKWDRPVNHPTTLQFTTANLAIHDLRVWGGSAGIVTDKPQPSGGNGQLELTFRVTPDLNNDPNQFDLAWKYAGPILKANSWNRYDGNSVNNLPFLLGARGKGLYFEVRNLTGSALVAGHYRVSLLAYEI